MASARSDADSLASVLSEIARWVYEHGGIEIVPKSIRIQAYRNTAGRESIRGKLNYRGPLQQRTNFPQLKIDLSPGEVLVQSPAPRAIVHDYSEQTWIPTQALCYTLDEIVAEKICALAARTRPRDLYDVVHLLEQGEYAVNVSTVREIIDKKCAHHGFEFPTLDAVANSRFRPVIFSEWENMLAHQVPHLRGSEFYWGRLPRVFSWLEGER